MRRRSVLGKRYGALPIRRHVISVREYENPGEYALLVEHLRIALYGFREILKFRPFQRHFPIRSRSDRNPCALNFDELYRRGMDSARFGNSGIFGQLAGRRDFRTARRWNASIFLLCEISGVGRTGGHARMRVLGELAFDLPECGRLRGHSGIGPRLMEPRSGKPRRDDERRDPLL